jgi:hypothetical protein
MENSSPTTLMISGMTIAAFSLKLMKNYQYLAYAAIIIGILFFTLGIYKYIKQRNDFI